VVTQIWHEKLLVYRDPCELNLTSEDYRGLGDKVEDKVVDLHILVVEGKVEDKGYKGQP